MSESDSNDDPDKDPTWEIKNKQVFENDTSTVQNSTDSLTTNKHASTYIMSPIGKISVETDSMHSQHNAQNMLQSSPSIVTTAKRVSFMSEPTKSNLGKIQNSTDFITKNKHASSYIMSPIGKILAETDTANSENIVHIENQHVSQSFLPTKRVLFSEPTKSNLVKTNKTRLENTLSTTAVGEFMMPTSDFQQFVINTLTKIKYDLTLLTTNTVHASQMSLETFFENSLSTSAHTSHVHYDPLSLDELFLIMDDESFNSFENKVQMDKNFRSNVVSNLALLVGIKDVGDSIRRIMSKMFSNEFLCEYSLQGFKKKGKVSSN